MSGGGDRSPSPAERRAQAAARKRAAAGTSGRATTSQPGPTTPDAPGDPADPVGPTRSKAPRSKATRSQVSPTPDPPPTQVPATTPPPARDESTDFLLQSLQDLDREREAGDIDEDDYLALRDDYTARAASALRAEQRGQRPPPTPAPRRSWLQRGLVLAGVAGFALLCGVLVAQAVGRRDTGEGITGEVTSSPTQVAARCIRLTGEGQYVEAIPCFQGVLEEDPDNAVARTYLGWTLVLTARQASDALDGDQLTELYVQARNQLDRAVETDPRYADARAFQVILAVGEGRFEEAQRQLELFDELDAPADVQRQVDTQRPLIEEGLAAQGDEPSSSTTAP